MSAPVHCHKGSDYIGDNYANHANTRSKRSCDDAVPARERWRHSPGALVPMNIRCRAAVQPSFSPPCDHRTDAQRMVSLDEDIDDVANINAGSGPAVSPGQELTYTGLTIDSYAIGIAAWAVIKDGAGGLWMYPASDLDYCATSGERDSTQGCLNTRGGLAAAKLAGRPLKSIALGPSPFLMHTLCLAVSQVVMLQLVCLPPRMARPVRKTLSAALG